MIEIYKIERNYTIGSPIIWFEFAKVYNSSDSDHLSDTIIDTIEVDEECVRKAISKIEDGDRRRDLANVTLAIHFEAEYIRKILGE